MLAVNFCSLRSLGQLEEDLSTQNMTRGGSSDRDWKVPTTRPSFSSSSLMPVMAVTPVGSLPRTWR